MTFKFGGLSIDPAELGSQGSAILGIRDSGKSYTATALAEKMLEAGIPFVAFDPIGVWRFMRVPGKGKGYPVVVAGGKAGDLPLTVQSAPEILRAAMHEGVSLVIDLFDINLSKADWKRIVTICLRVLLHENPSLRHVYIEEAAEFAPQRVGPDQGQVYAEMEKLARMGGNSRLGYTLINQRAEEVNKAVLELCDNLFLHRQKGRNSLTALSKWLDIGAVKDHKAIIDSLSTLPTGECWAWLAGSERPVRIHVPAKNSFHPDRRAMRGEGKIKVKAAVDVGKFVTSMRGSLEKIVEDAKANDPAALKTRIAELERQLKDSPEADARVTNIARNAGFEEGYNSAWDAFAKQVDNAVGDAITQAQKLIDDLEEINSKLNRRGPPPFKGISEKPLLNKKMLVSAVLTAVKPGPHHVILDRIRAGDVVNFKSQHKNSDGNAPTGLQGKILNAIAWLADKGINRPSQQTVGAVAGAKAGGGYFRNTVSAMRTAGLLEPSSSDGVICATDAGKAAATHANVHGEIHDQWLGILRGLEREIVKTLIEYHPRPMSREDLGNALGKAESAGYFRNMMSRLSTMGAIEYPRPGMVALTKYVMPEGR